MKFFYSFSEKNMPYAYPLENAISGQHWFSNTLGLTPWGAPNSGERTCRGTTSSSTVTLAQVLESSVLPKKETRGRRRR
jgi:hypothetical protein